MASSRSDKVGDLLKKEISLIIANQIKDPRLQNINITAVKVSDDIGIATVFYTVIGAVSYTHLTLPTIYYV